VPYYIKDARVALVIGDKVYLVGVETNHIMMYDPLTDTYTAKNNFPGTEPTTGFVVKGEAFFIGADGSCWKYEPATDNWQQKASLPPSIISMRGFSLKEDGYIIGDLNRTATNNNELMKVWRYDTKMDKWHEFEEPYPVYGLGEISTVSMADYVVVGLGFENSDFNTIDFWRFK
jgi:N-acetylneuraminic acid mutarotase